MALGSECVRKKQNERKLKAKSVSLQELLKIQNKRREGGLKWEETRKGRRQKTEVCPQSH